VILNLVFIVEFCVFQIAIIVGETVRSVDPRWSDEGVTIW